MNDRQDRDRDRDRRDRDRRDRERDRRDQARGPRPASDGSGRRVGMIFAIGGVLAALLAVTSGLNGPKRPPAPERLDTMSAKRVTEHVVENGIIGAALAAERAQEAAIPPHGLEAVEGRTALLAQRNERAERNVSVKVSRSPRGDAEGGSLTLKQVRSREPHTTPEAAKADAIEQARRELGKQLLALDPPIDRLPSAAAVRDHYVRADSVRTILPKAEDKQGWEEAKLDSNRVWVEVDVEVSGEQLRQLRGESRVWAVGKLVGAIFLVLGAVYGFFRLDGLTRGYLTWALVAGLAVLAVAAVAGLTAVG